VLQVLLKNNFFALVFVDSFFLVCDMAAKMLASMNFHYIKGKDTSAFKQREELPFSSKFNFSKALEMKLAKLLSVSLLFLNLGVICLNILFNVSPFRASVVHFFSG